MKATGIIRPVDELGRVVIPVEIRRNFDIAIKDELEIFVEDDSIILRKHSPACVFCNSKENISEFKGKSICAKCLKELA